MKNIFITVVVCLSLAGCEFHAPPPENVVMLEKTERFKVDRVASFEDRLAYEDVRSIYIIHDLQTGKEYIGVSGIGISEVSRHSKTAGKHPRAAQDER